MTFTDPTLEASISSGFMYDPEHFQMRLKEEFLRSHRINQPFIFVEIPEQTFDILGFQRKNKPTIMAWKIAVLTLFNSLNPIDVRGFLPDGGGIGLILMNRNEQDLQLIKQEILKNLKKSDLFTKVRFNPNKPLFKAHYHPAQIESKHRQTIQSFSNFNFKSEGFFSLESFLYSNIDLNHWNSKIINWIKRSLDFTGALLGLILLFPIFLFIGLAIKFFEPKAPLLFEQKRLGMNGDTFIMWKFRSMYIDAEERKAELIAQGLNEADGPAFKMKNDPRITPIGRFIRKYSLDELPQLWNVFKGEMALVGPRPPLEEEVLEYLPWHKMRLSVKPGLTCHWQVSGRSDLDFDDWMRLDNKYVRHGNLRTDINLIRKTFGVVIKGDGAY